MQKLALALTMMAAVVLTACGGDVRPLAPTVRAPSVAIAAAPTEADAIAISRVIQQRHWPYLTLLNPRFVTGESTSPDFMTLAPSGYTQAADNAIWTGHYLAAEATRYAVTGSPGSLANAKRALHGITALIDVTQSDVLARFLIPRSSPYADAILAEEAHEGIYESTYRKQRYAWLGGTSRDQYSGVFFGLGVAYDMIPIGRVRAEIRKDVSRMLANLIANGWSVKMPDGSYSTTFVQRPDQQLSFLQVGRHVDPARWSLAYQSFRAANAALVRTPIETECQDPYGSYYKFNLDHINLYNLIRLEEPGVFRTLYLQGFAALRSCTGTHQNAHFNMIERALLGADALRDAETVNLLSLWLMRPRRDYYVDNTGRYPACGAYACAPIPVNDRYTTDFLWQRNPFQLAGGGAGTIETPGVDYILPYWMARYYGVLSL